MKTVKVFSAILNGTFTQISAYRKEGAVAWFQQQDSNIKESDVRWLKGARNSHQAPVDEK